MQYFESFSSFPTPAPGQGTTGRISGTVKPIKRRSGANGFHPPDARIPKHVSQPAAGPLLRLQHNLRPAKQRRGEADPNVACFAGCTHICKQTPAISTMPVVGVVAHVGIIRTFKTEQFGRSVDRTGDLAVTQLYRNPCSSTTSTVRWAVARAFGSTARSAETLSAKGRPEERIT